MRFVSVLSAVGMSCFGFPTLVINSVCLDSTVLVCYFFCFRLFLLLPGFALVGSSCSVFERVQLNSSSAIRYFPFDSCLFLVVMICIDSPALVVESVFEESSLSFCFFSRIVSFYPCVEALCSVLDSFHFRCLSSLGCPSFFVVASN